MNSDYFFCTSSVSRMACQSLTYFGNSKHVCEHYSITLLHKKMRNICPMIVIFCNINVVICKAYWNTYNVFLIMDKSYCIYLFSTLLH